MGIDGELDGGAHKPRGAFLGDGLDADAAGFRETDLRKLLGKGLLHEGQKFRVGLRSLLELDARVDVLAVLAEDHHVHFFGVLHGARYALEPAHRAQANIEIQLLSQGHVQAGDAAADGRGQRTFDAHQIVAAGLHCGFGKPVVELLVALLTSEDFHPLDLAFPTIGLGHRRVEHAHRGPPDIRACSITFDERDDGAIRNMQFSIFNADLLTVHGRNDLKFGHGVLLEIPNSSVP